MTVQNYLTQISNSNPGYVANWPPNIAISVGDVGSLSKEGFKKFASIDNLQLQITEPTNLSQLEGTIINSPNGSVLIDFSDSKGFVLQATEVISQAAADLVSVEKKILNNLNEKWRHEWYIVTGVQIATVATIIVSNGNDAAVGLTGTFGAPPLMLAGTAQLSVNTSTSRGSTLSWITSKFPVLMYQALKFTDWPLPRPQHLFYNLTGRLPYKTIERLPQMEALTVEEVLHHFKE